MNERTFVVSYKNKLVEIYSGALQLELMVRSKSSAKWGSPGGRALILPEGKTYFRSLGARFIGGNDATFRVAESKLGGCEKVWSNSELWVKYLESSVRRELDEEMVHGDRCPKLLSLAQLDRWSLELINTRCIDGDVLRPRKKYWRCYIREHRAKVPREVMNSILHSDALRLAIENGRARIRKLGTCKTILSRREALSILYP